ncbi:TonB-dependent siderophore receptor [Paracoccus xiamenensis]|uniref:TonB-dependent siderophore receptor n=1 Tax=Paracoccus xiamenensis TaxID=2714901 RepID=UPI00140DED8B|nr:TonB-dependent receptor [Paracoccus xiamenensis]NHF74644.1 TonB-dependent receptor [Paracoccus xiamenensis]
MAKKTSSTFSPAARAPIGCRHLLSLLVASTVLGGAVLTSARPAVAQATIETANFQIPAQSLSSAINTFIRQSGWQISYSSALVRDKTSTAVNGNLAPDVALQRLVAGTGIEVRISAPGSAALTGPAGAAIRAEDGSILLDTIIIQGANPNSTFEVPDAYVGGQVATGGQVGMLGNRDVMNTPFSQTSYTNKTIQNQQARTVHDVLANDPSVITNRSASRHDWETIRGFSNSGQNGGRSLNGLNGIAPIEFPGADYLERVDVLKGPSALLIGMGGAGHGNIGGSVNLVTKQAGDEPLTEVTTRFESRSQLGAHVDLGRRFGPNKEFGIRFNGAFDKGDTNVDTQHAKNGIAALNLDYRGERTRLSFDFAHETRDLNPISNIASIRSIADTLSKVPDAPDSSKSLFPSWAMRESS